MCAALAFYPLFIFKLAAFFAIPDDIIVMAIKLYGLFLVIREEIVYLIY